MQLSVGRPAWGVPTSVAEVLLPGVQDAPDRQALVDRRRSLTYRDLDVLVDGVARGLVHRGLAPGDRIAVSLPNCVDVVVAMLASMRAGAVFVGVHPSLAAVEKQRLVTHADAALVLTTRQVAENLDTSADIVSLDLDDGGVDVLAGPRAELPRIDPRRPAAVAFTSGTTGEPKGVVHDQYHAMLPPAVIVHDRLGGRGERVGVQLPLTTLNVAILGPLLAFVGRGTCVCIDTHQPAALAALIDEHDVEHLSCSPATVHDLVMHPDVHHAQLAGLRLGVGGATCPEWLRAAYRDRFGSDFTTGYGLSEAPTSVTQETERVPHREGASGVAMAHVRIAILDEAGRGVPAGTVGEIAVGPATTGPWAMQWRGMLGYWKRPDLTAAARRGDLLLTGDSGWLDGDGYLYVADRRSELINRGGSKVSPIEVERALREHPDVGDCLVLGRRDDRLGEVVVAAVEAREGRVIDELGLRSHAATLVARFKVPEEILVVDHLPRNPMGKIDRGAVRALFGARPPG